MKGKRYIAHTSVLSFKDKRLRSHMDIYLWQYLRPILLQLETGPEPHSEDTDGSVAPAERSWQGNATPPSTQLQIFTQIKIDLGSCFLLEPRNHLLHVQAVRQKDSDIISERGDLRCKVSKRDTIQGRICPLISKPPYQGIQSVVIEKRRQGASLPDRLLDRESYPALPVHLHRCQRDVAHYAAPFAELWLDARHQFRLLFPLGSRTPIASYLCSIFPSQVNNLVLAMYWGRPASTLQRLRIQ